MILFLFICHYPHPYPHPIPVPSPPHSHPIPPATYYQAGTHSQPVRTHTQSAARTPLPAAMPLGSNASCPGSNAATSRQRCRPTGSDAALSLSPQQHIAHTEHHSAHSGPSGIPRRRGGVWLEDSLADDVDLPHRTPAQHPQVAASAQGASAAAAEACTT